MTTYDPSHLRNAADLLWKRGATDAASILRTEADAIQKQKLEDELYFKIGSHFRHVMEQGPSRWKFTMTSDDLRVFGKAAKEAVDKHAPKSVGTAWGVGGGGGAAASARSPYPPNC